MELFAAQSLHGLVPAPGEQGDADPPGPGQRPHLVHSWGGPEPHLSGHAEGMGNSSASGFFAVIPWTEDPLDMFGFHFASLKVPSKGVPQHVPRLQATETMRPTKHPSKGQKKRFLVSQNPSKTSPNWTTYWQRPPKRFLVSLNSSKTSPKSLVSQNPSKATWHLVTFFFLGPTPQARISGALGGRAAEQLVFGTDQVTTGAGGDLQQAGVDQRASPL